MQRNFSPLQWVLLVCSAIFAVLWLVSLFLLLSGGAAQVKNALDVGKQARIILSSGAIEGNIFKPNEKIEVSSNIAKAPQASAGKLPQEKSATPDAKTPNASKSPTSKSPVDTSSTITKTPVEVYDVSSPMRPSLNPSLVEVTDEGKIPKINAENVLPWQYYSRPDKVAADKPVISITITGLGIDNKTTEFAMSLPPEVTLSFSPYADNLEQLVSKARIAGHEVWLDLPMEFADFPASDPGPLALLKDNSVEENIKRMHKIMASASGYVGFIAPENEILSTYRSMDLFVAELKQRGLLVAMRNRDYRPAGTASGSKILYMDSKLDRFAGEDGWMDSLVGLQDIAIKQQTAILLTEPTPAQAVVLDNWFKNRTKSDVALAPLSAIAKR